MSEFPKVNPENLPILERNIASAILFTSDDKIIMGRKNPEMGGVYPDAWHIPGGGIEDGESLEDAVNREVYEETGLDIHDADRKTLPVGYGSVRLPI